MMRSLAVLPSAMLTRMHSVWQTKCYISAFIWTVCSEVKKINKRKQQATHSQNWQHLIITLCVCGRGRQSVHLEGTNRVKLITRALARQQQDNPQTMDPSIALPWCLQYTQLVVPSVLHIHTYCHMKVYCTAQCQRCGRNTTRNQYDQNLIFDMTFLIPMMIEITK